MILLSMLFNATFYLSLPQFVFLFGCFLALTHVSFSFRNRNIPVIQWETSFHVSSETLLARDRAQSLEYVSIPARRSNRRRHTKYRLMLPRKLQRILVSVGKILDVKNMQLDSNPGQETTSEHLCLCQKMSVGWCSLILGSIRTVLEVLESRSGNYFRFLTELFICGLQDK